MDAANLAGAEVENRPITLEGVKSMMTFSTFAISPDFDDSFACPILQISSLCSQWCDEISKLAHTYQVSTTDVERQIKLHAPQFELSRFKGSGTRLPDELRSILARRFIDYPAKVQEWARGGDAVDTGLPRWEDAAVSHVSAKMGLEIESNFHYLRNPRRDAHIRIGVRADASELPILYASSGICDRSYIEEALSCAIDTQVKDTWTIARVYSTRSLPKNSMSRFYRAIIRRLREEGAQYVVTAINPFLGFNGRSVIASDFHPFALAPVTYQYDENGIYTTRRNLETPKIFSSWQPPSNVLLVRGLTKQAYQRIQRIRSVVNITEKAPE